MQAKVRLVTTCIIEVSVKNEKKSHFFKNNISEVF